MKPTLFGKSKENDNPIGCETTVRIENDPMHKTEYAQSSHIGTREYQQDTTRAGRGKAGVLFGVLCDGMGGLEDGEAASRMAAEDFAQALSEADPDGDIPLLLNDLAHKVNALVFNLPSQTGQSGVSGTTITAAMITGDRLFWISAGDSRIYIIRKKEIVSVTRDHSYSLELDELVRQGRLEPEKAAEDPRRNALISYLGLERLEILDYNSKAFILEAGDIVLLCSDGLYRSLDDSEILDIMERHSDNIEECARVLPIYAFDRAQGNQDNTSVILLKYNF